jgi:hypothetical protein
MYQYEFVVWAYNGGQLRIAGYVKLFRSVHCVWGLVMAGQLRGVIIPQRLSVASNAIDHPSLGHNNNDNNNMAGGGDGWLCAVR